ncbi:MAG: hypothetical protein F6K16_22550 [Symploca sp. SIO2B6]|nr:hypothetical protein [Symploca sp. SIO2B6]
MRSLYGRLSILLLATLSATPVLSQGSNFDKLTLSLGFPQNSGLVAGYTGGSYSLSSIANKDDHGQACIGFGDETPDHIMVLEQDFSNLSVLVNTGGKDTTLVIQGPQGNSNQGNMRCGDDTGSSKDASVEDSSWQAGTYKIWVGSFEAGQQWDYTLTVRE